MNYQLRYRSGFIVSQWQWKPLTGPFLPWSSKKSPRRAEQTTSSTVPFSSVFLKLCSSFHSTQHSDLNGTITFRSSLNIQTPARKLQPYKSARGRKRFKSEINSIPNRWTLIKLGVLASSGQLQRRVSDRHRQLRCVGSRANSCQVRQTRKRLWTPSTGRCIKTAL